MIETDARYQRSLTDRSAVRSASHEIAHRKDVKAMMDTARQAIQPSAAKTDESSTESQAPSSTLDHVASTSHSAVMTASSDIIAFITTEAAKAENSLNLSQRDLTELPPEIAMLTTLERYVTTH